jgi:hypothetical protein
MKPSNQLLKQPFSLGSFINPALAGAAIGFILIGLFLAGTPASKPEWGQFWMLRPLIIVPLAGAAGGASFKLLSGLILQPVWARVLLNFFGALIFIISLWLGSVLGLVGTYWH